MYPQEYSAWRQVALVALSSIYNEAQCAAIIAFFDEIKGASEFDLTGNDFQDALSIVRNEIISSTGFSLYHDLMARVWLYAPLILKAESLRIKSA